MKTKVIILIIAVLLLLKPISWLIMFLIDQIFGVKELNISL
jgi:hypothetical protein